MADRLTALFPAPCPVAFGGGASEVVVTYLHTSDASGDPPLYKINGFSVTQSEFESYQQWQDSKKDVTWYDFTASNIQILCS